MPFPFLRNRRGKAPIEIKLKKEVTGTKQGNTKHRLSELQKKH